MSKLEIKKYSENYKRDVKKEGIVEKKGQFDYISWSHAEKIANELDSEFNWVAIPNSFGSLNHDGLILIEMEFLGKKRRHYYPILDFKNKPIEKPTPFDINNAQMRGMAKLFSMMSGIGLSLFTGEDLRIYDEKARSTRKAQTEKTSVFNFVEYVKKLKLQDEDLENARLILKSPKLTDEEKKKKLDEALSKKAGKND